MLNPTFLSDTNRLATSSVSLPTIQQIALWAAFLILTFICSPSLSARDYAPLKKQLQEAVADYKAQVGIAIIVDGKDTLTINNDGHYPMMSVYKFHQALAVAHHLEQHGISLDTMIYVKKEELRPDTYSPFRDRYPEGNTLFSVKELLTYTLQWSDNNACDILFDHILNTRQTDTLLRSLGMNHFNIVATELEMQSDPEKCYDNWSTPLASAKLLDDFVTRRIVTGPYYDFILHTMLDCTTGAQRLPAGLPGNKVQIGHKTGTSMKNKQGVYTGVNDIGFVYTTENRRYSIAVYIKNSKEDLSTNEQIIAEVSRKVYSFLKTH